MCFWCSVKQNLHKEENDGWSQSIQDPNISNNVKQRKNDAANQVICIKTQPLLQNKNFTEPSVSQTAPVRVIEDDPTFLSNVNNNGTQSTITSQSLIHRTTHSLLLTVPDKISVTTKVKVEDITLLLVKRLLNEVSHYLKPKNVKSSQTKSSDLVLTTINAKPDRLEENKNVLLKEDTHKEFIIVPTIRYKLQMRSIIDDLKHCLSKIKDIKPMPSSKLNHSNQKTSIDDQSISLSRKSSSSEPKMNESLPSKWIHTSMYQSHSSTSNNQPQIRSNIINRMSALVCLIERKKNMKKNSQIAIMYVWIPELIQPDTSIFRRDLQTIFQ